ncbi:MAG: RMD1 family protein [Clostridiaceae bacterium]|nr:RMD1 family protein [Clostridiaceae bacterium]
MDRIIFKAYAISSEIDLNKMADQCHIPKKYTWEEPLILYGNALSSILKREVKNQQKVMVFSFGSVVFINCTDSDELVFMEYLKSNRSDIDLKSYKKYSDDYQLEVRENSEIELTDRYVIVPKFEAYHPELISTVIAKSVALEKTEEKLSKIVYKLETMIDKLEKGKLNIGNKEIANTTSQIVRHEYNTLAYIMILDKPDITWSSIQAEEFYNCMAEFFELNDRYIILKEKTNILNSIIDGFSSITHSIRGLFVEWIIVLLILVEIVLMILDLLR